MTPTPAAPELIDEEFFPNPWSGEGDAYITFLLKGPAERVVIKVFSTSYRKLRETTIEKVSGGSYVKARFDGLDSLGGRLANGIYLYVIEVHEGEKIIDRKMGKLVILR